MARSRDPEAYDRFKRAAEAPMLLASLAFVVVLLAPALLNLGEAARESLAAVGWIIWALFVGEYLTLLYLAPSRRKMIRSHWLDLLIIVLPFLRPLRAARVLRFLRLLTVAGRFAVALRTITSRSGFRAFGAVAAIVIAAGAALTYGFERNQPEANITSMADALWWAIVTSTTVGYGDHFPVSAEGRGVAVVLMLLGIGMLSVVTANIAAYFLESSEATASDDVSVRLERIEALLMDLMADDRSANR